MRLSSLWALALALGGVLLSSPANATEANGRSGLIWPGSAPLEGGEVALGTGVSLGLDGGAEPMSAVWTHSADVVWAPAPGVAVEAQGAYGGGLSMSTLGARWVAHEGRALSVAPWVAGLVVGPAENTGWDLVLTPGVSLDWGSERWRGDVAAPLAGLLFRGEDTQVLPTILMGEVGVTWHPAQTTSLRLGFGPILPTFRWRQELGAVVFTDVLIGFLDGGVAQARVGARW